MQQIDGKAKLTFQGRRMIFALTKKGNLVWASFLDEPNEPSMYLCTWPSLDHGRSNIDIKSIDYSTVAEELGTLASPSNIKDRAFVAWSYFGAMELKTLRRLELREPGMRYNPIDLDAYFCTGRRCDQRYCYPWDYSPVSIEHEDQEYELPVDDMNAEDSDQSVDFNFSFKSGELAEALRELEAQDEQILSASLEEDFSAGHLELASADFDEESELVVDEMDGDGVVECNRFVAAEHASDGFSGAEDEQALEEDFSGCDLELASANSDDEQDSVIEEDTYW
ncbi:hypothetical protein BDU57DRAFT_516537 [Ampelomyces quisqualis]|uniref:Uncharacterized protein n=1 Tax=Ampelomyces quisqualis TaxID=50730 RepID=A0A6A5QPH2_AMPQU|nr:hypothetical protein BDU57DRAFT_516537 [Ampelomyces quisqualis]